MGGGFDLFCGLPLYFELTDRGQTVHLANYSFADIENMREGNFLTETLVGITADFSTRYVYFPELYLAQWFRQKHNTETIIWCFHKTGVRPLLENYVALVDHLNIDGILLIDGGVDSLLKGDEAQLGTFLEDTVSLIAVSELKQVSTKLIGCIAFGAERDMTYAHVFENMAAITKLGAYFGACALTQQMECYQLYEEAVLYAQNQPMQDASVINSSLISAVRGEYGNYHLTDKTRGSHLWISPLMPLYWFFSLDVIARRNLVYSELRYTDTFIDAWRAFAIAHRTLPSRKPTRIPLT
jgi:hypothetical protein